MLAVLAPVGGRRRLIPIRDDVDNTNVALLLVVVVVAVASVGARTAAALAALSAAASFNFFFTAPYYSLRIESRDDVETAVLLLLVGLAVGELASRGLRAQAAAARGRRDLASLHSLGALVAKGEDADYVLMATEAELTHLLGLAACRFEISNTDDAVLPVIARDRDREVGPQPLGDGPLGPPVGWRHDPGVVAGSVPWSLRADGTCRGSRTPLSSWRTPWPWWTRRAPPSPLDRPTPDVGDRAGGEPALPVAGRHLRRPCRAKRGPEQASTQVVEGEVELEDVHAGLAEEAEVAARRCGRRRASSTSSSSRPALVGHAARPGCGRWPPRCAGRGCWPEPVTASTGTSASSARPFSSR